MRRTFTLFTAIAVLLTLSASAQYTQNFETSTLTSGCSLTTNANLTTDPLEVITGLSSLTSNPPVSSSGTRDYATPYLNINDPLNSAATTTTFTVSFNYKLTTKLVGAATRTIAIGLQNKNGVFTPLYTINMDKNNTPIVPTAYLATYTVATGVYRLVLKMGGSAGLGTAKTVIDDLYASANPYYSLLGSTCNPAPSINNDFYMAPSLAPYNGTSVLANDSDPNGESLSTPAVQTASPDGTVVFNADGSFTFTPNAGFTGPSTTFTYVTYDNGYDPASGIGTVTIFFSSAAPLPVKLISFQGALISNKTQLKWAVADNEIGKDYVIEKSTDGKTYSSIGLVFSTEKSGTESYVFNDPALLNGGAYYRICMNGKDGSKKYTNVIFLKNTEAGKNSGIVWIENPVKSSLTFSYDATSSGLATVSVYNMTGVRVQTFQVMLQKGVNALVHPADNRMATGTYVLEVSTATERRTVKITK